MFGSSWSGQSVPIVPQEFTDHKLTLPHLSLIPPLPYMSLCFYSSLRVDCFVLARVSCEIHCSLPVPLFPCAAGLIARRSSSSCGPHTQTASSGISASLKQLLYIVFVILCFVAIIKISPFSNFVRVLYHPHLTSSA